MRLRAVVTVVTYQNSPAQLALYARALKTAAAEAADVCDTTLLYQDNASESGLDRMVPGAIRRPSQGNAGYGPALAGLLEDAFGRLGADIVMTSNPDGAFHHGCIATLVARAQADPRQLLEACQFPEEHPKHFDALSGDTEWASGCCMAVPRAVFEEIGNIDPAFWLYLEDVDYSWRTRAHGIPVRLVPDALYAHDVTDRRISPQRRQQMLLSGRRLGIKWRNGRFAASCERMLRAEFPHYPAAQWDCLEKIAPIPLDWARVGNFRHLFSFAPTRW